MAKLSEKYEAVVVFSLKNGEDAVKALVAKFSDLIKEHGTLVDVDDLHEPAGQGQDTVFLAGHQQHAQGQAKHQRQRRADHGDVKRLPDGKGQRGQHRHQVLYGLGGEQITVHGGPPPLPAHWPHCG